MVSMAVGTAALCWGVLVLDGLDAGRWCAAVGVALATVVARVGLVPKDTPVPPMRSAGRTVTRHAYPRYEKIASTVQWGVQDRRYFDRVLAPLLHDIARDLDPAAPPESLRTRLGEKSWSLLDPKRPLATGAPGDQAAPTVAELTVLLDRLEDRSTGWS